MFDTRASRCGTELSNHCEHDFELSLHSTQLRKCGAITWFCTRDEAKPWYHPACRVSEVAGTEYVQVRDARPWPQTEPSHNLGFNLDLRLKGRNFCTKGNNFFTYKFDVTWNGLLIHLCSACGPNDLPGERGPVCQMGWGVLKDDALVPRAAIFPMPGRDF